MVRFLFGEVFIRPILIGRLALISCNTLTCQLTQFVESQHVCQKLWRSADSNFSQGINMKDVLFVRPIGMVETRKQIKIKTKEHLKL